MGSRSGGAAGAASHASSSAGRDLMSDKQLVIAEQEAAAAHLRDADSLLAQVAFPSRTPSLSLSYAQLIFSSPTRTTPLAHARSLRPVFPLT
jgi:hypothetical protein